MTDTVAVPVDVLIEFIYALEFVHRAGHQACEAFMRSEACDHEAECGASYAPWRVTDIALQARDEQAPQLIIEQLRPRPTLRSI